MTTLQLKELRREYIPYDRDCGQRAFARRFNCSVTKIHYWLLSDADRVAYNRAVVEYRRKRVARLEA